MLHTGLTSDKWKSFNTDKQVLMIANEMNRANNWIEKQDYEKVKPCYERALELIDLTVICSVNLSFKKELLRFRELIGLHYINNNFIDDGLYQVLLSLNVNSFNLLRL